MTTHDTLITLLQPGDTLTLFNACVMTCAGKSQVQRDSLLQPFYQKHGGLINLYIVAARDTDGFQMGVQLTAINCVQRAGVLLWDTHGGLHNAQPVQLELFEVT